MVPFEAVCGFMCIFSKVKERMNGMLLVEREAGRCWRWRGASLILNQTWLRRGQNWQLCLTVVSSFTSSGCTTGRWNRWDGTRLLPVGVCRKGGQEDKGWRAGVDGIEEHRSPTMLGR